MKKLRCSYTLLSLWRAGRYQDAVDFYLKKPTPKSPAMIDGLKWDSLACDYALKNNKMLDEFGSDILSNPQVQVKVEAQFSDQVDLVGVYDILSDNIIYELKTGNSKDSADYSNDFQISLYLLLAELKNIPVEKSLILHYDQHAGTHDRTLIWNTEIERERGKNFVESLVPEIYDYFQKEGIL